MIRITGSLLASLSTKERPEFMEPLAVAMNEFFPKYEIIYEKRVEHFLAQALHEADGFRTLEEYASGAAYEERKDLGNVKPGDGRKYKGRGIFQTTGRANYTRAGKKMSLDLVQHPELLSQPRNAVWSACIYWDDHNLNELADRDDVKAITKRINGGLNGFEDRLIYLGRTRQAIK